MFYSQDQSVSFSERSPSSTSSNEDPFIEENQDLESNREEYIGDQVLEELEEEKNLKLEPRNPSLEN